MHALTRETHFHARHGVPGLGRYVPHACSRMPGRVPEVPQAASRDRVPGEERGDKYSRTASAVGPPANEGRKSRRARPRIHIARSASHAYPGLAGAVPHVVCGGERWQQAPTQRMPMGLPALSRTIEAIPHSAPLPSIYKARPFSRSP
ncbi:hypothetical protein JB92DRAFT_763613 [Gautieria morchelliformis]|nr:hypothetical protein JB92DRAFT_763613 [Gautieria morchelliformis]